MSKYLMILGSIIAIMLMVGLGIFLVSRKGETIEPSTIQNQTSQPESTKMDLNTPVPSSSSAVLGIDKTKSYEAVLSTTEGEITIKLNADQMPITVNNFVTLAQKNFYNNTIFHRVIKGFMIQGGDPKGDGTGGPGYSFNDEPFEGSYTRGTVAMANAGPNTNGSQFFIMQADVSLPHAYVIFGQVVSGMDVVDKIALAPVTSSGSGEDSKPVSPVTVNAVQIVEQ